MPLNHGEIPHVSSYKLPEGMSETPRIARYRPQGLVGGRTDPQRHREKTKIHVYFTSQNWWRFIQIWLGLKNGDFFWQMMGFLLRVESQHPLYDGHMEAELLEKCPMFGSEHISVSLKSLEIWPKSDGDKKFLATVSPQTSPLKYRLEHFLGFFHPHQFFCRSTCLFLLVPSSKCYLQRPVESLYDFGLFGW